MNRIRPKQPRQRLDLISYQHLCRRVIERDRWRCQSCCAMEQLQVHHKQFRSRSGNDSEENLITLCKRCHEFEHR